MSDNGPTSDFILAKECQELAQEIFDEMTEDMARDETPEDKRDDMMDRAHEAADGHLWVIYTHYVLMMCAHCDTTRGEEFVDDVGLPQPFTLQSAATAVAYGEMRARIEEELSELIDNWEDTRPEEDDEEEEGVA